MLKVSFYSRSSCNNSNKPFFVDRSILPHGVFQCIGFSNVNSVEIRLYSHTLWLQNPVRVIRIS